jgi:hypothetical protein
MSPCASMPLVNFFLYLKKAPRRTIHDSSVVSRAGRATRRPCQGPVHQSLSPALWLICQSWRLSLPGASTPFSVLTLWLKCQSWQAVPARGQYTNLCVLLSGWIVKADRLSLPWASTPISVSCSLVELSKLTGCPCQGPVHLSLSPTLWLKCQRWQAVPARDQYTNLCLLLSGWNVKPDRVSPNVTASTPISVLYSLAEMSNLAGFRQTSLPVHLSLSSTLWLKCQSWQVGSIIWVMSSTTFQYCVYWEGGANHPTFYKLARNHMPCHTHLRQIFLLITCTKLYTKARQC